MRLRRLTPAMFTWPSSAVRCRSSSNNERDRMNKGWIVSLGLLLACAVVLPAQTVQKVIDEYLQAQGGKKAVAQIRTETIAGSLIEEASGKTGSWSLITKAPNRFYFEIIAG